MSTSKNAIFDGIGSGLVFSVLIFLLCQFLETSRPCTSNLFLAGIMLTVGSLFLGIIGQYGPPGLLSALDLLPKDERKQKPDPEEKKGPKGRTFWMDRSISSRNTWLIAGLTMVLISYLVQFRFLF